MSVTITIPSDLEQKLRAQKPDLDAVAREAFVVQLFRNSDINHFQLSALLGLNRFETDALLKRYRVEEQSLTLEDVEADCATLVDFLNEA